MTCIEKLIKYNGTTSPVSQNGFLHPDGTFTAAIAEHYVTCRHAGTTLKTYMKAGGLRIYFYADSFAIEGMNGKATKQQLQSLKSILKNTNIGYAIVCLGKKAQSISVFTGVKFYHIEKIIERL